MNYVETAAKEHAFRLAAEAPEGTEIGVYVMHGEYFVRRVEDAPENVDFVAIAQRWDKDVVQMRTMYGTSEFIDITGGY